MAKTRNDICIVFHEDNTCEIQKVEDASSESILTKSGMYPFDEMQKFSNISSSNLVYVAGTVDMDARIEAKNLRNLRKSTALQSMMKFDVKDKMDIFKFLPWIVIALLILFK